jgi:hypothetical protein
MKSDHNLLQGLAGETPAGEFSSLEGGGQSVLAQAQTATLPDTKTEHFSKLVYMEVVNFMYGFTTSLV